MKTVIVTGAGSGLGKELTLRYANPGDRFLLIGRRLDKLTPVVEVLEAKGIESAAYSCDISDLRAVRQLMSMVRANFEQVDMLINCAGVGYFGPLASTSEQEIHAMVDINLKGTIFMTQSFEPIVRKRVLTIISTAGLKGKPNEAVYVASKYGVRGFMESLQNEFEGQERFTSVYMGGMDTPFWDESDHIADKSRLKSPVEVAEEIFQMDDGRLEIHINKK